MQVDIDELRSIEEALDLFSRGNNQVPRPSQSSSLDRIIERSSLNYENLAALTSGCLNTATVLIRQKTPDVNAGVEYINRAVTCLSKASNSRDTQGVKNYIDTVALELMKDLRGLEFDEEIGKVIDILKKADGIMGSFGKLKFS